MEEVKGFIGRKVTRGGVEVKRWIGWGVVVLVILASGWYLMGSGGGKMLSPGGAEIKKELPYDKYSFSRLVERKDEAGKIEVVGETFSYLTEGKKVTGAITIPEGEGPWPVVVMLRGYADKEVYYTGYGTKNGAKYFAEHGYVALAPDFLGYGGSDPEDEDTLGARVKRPATILDLLSSLASLDFVDTDKVYLWGHSNGGQIALSVLEILGKRGDERVRGATVWAPVSKPFPYSILYYTDGYDDAGKEMRRVIARWEEQYDAFEYSIERYYTWIKTPIQIHQGTADEAVPKAWSDELASQLEKLGKEVKYYVYPGADHNLKGGWNTVVKRDVAWFSSLEQ